MLNAYARIKEFLHYRNTEEYKDFTIAQNAVLFIKIFCKNIEKKRIAQIKTDILIARQ